MGDPELHPEPAKWDPYRFLRISEQHPEKESEAQLVTTSPNHLAFGHGAHACSGRFFAANEIKIIMCHMIVKYDWKLAPGSDISPKTLGMTNMSNPDARVLIRRRKAVEMEVDVDSFKR